MIRQRYLARFKFFSFFIFSLCLHLSVLFLLFHNDNEKNRFISVPIDVSFVSPIDVPANAGLAQENTAPEPKKETVAEKPEPEKDVIKIEKKDKQKKQINIEKKEEKSKQEQVKKEPVSKKEVTETQTDKNDGSENSNVDPFKTFSNGTSKGVMFENSNFNFSYYTTSIVKKIRRNWRWTSNQSLRAVVYFKIDRNGNVLATKIKESSGNEYFDENALRTIQASDPFAPLPESYSEKDLGVYFEFKFN